MCGVWVSISSVLSFGKLSIDSLARVQYSFDANLEKSPFYSVNSVTQHKHKKGNISFHSDVEHVYAVTNQSIESAQFDL